MRKREQQIVDLLSDGREWFVLDMGKALGLGPWRTAGLYRHLAALESRGLVYSGWTAGDPPRRRWYAEAPF